MDDLDEWALAGIGALVGLFSKNALEKLREVFNTLFRTEDDLGRELLGRLPAELSKQVRPFLTVRSGDPQPKPKDGSPLDVTAPRPPAAPADAAAPAVPREAT